MISPQPGPQTKFLASSADITIIGGSAGGGKSFSLLMDPLPYLLEVPDFHGVIFRRTFPEIDLPGGMWDTSVELYRQFDGIPRRGKLEWLFPHDNTLSFHHLQHSSDVYSWQGSQVAYMGWDELTHFTEAMFSYIVFSRGRSACEVDSYTRGSCNPDPGWVKEFLAPWVDSGFEGAKAKSGDVLYFIRNDVGKMVWVPRGTPDCKSLSFVRAMVHDNPIMLAKNPRYISSLKALPPIERARLLDGNWDVRREGLVYPGFESCISDSGGNGSPQVGGIDFGFSNPFAAVYGHLDHDGVLWITGCRYVRQCTLPIHAEALPKGVRYWCDPAQPESRVELRNAGHDAIPCVHLRARGSTGEMKKPILHGIDLVSERIRSNKLKVIRSACLPLIREMSMYCYDPEKQSENPIDADNHACDALRYLIVGLDRGNAIPQRDYESEPEPPKQPLDDDDERWWR